MTNLDRLQRVQDRLHESQQRYRLLSRRLLEQEEQVRGSLARELHVQLGQSLAAASARFAAVKGDLTARAGARIPERMRIIEKMIG